MLRGVLLVAVFVVSTAVLGTLAILGEALLPSRHVCFRLGRLWSRIHLLAAGCRVEYEGHENLESRAPCVFVSTHQSNLDVFALALVLPASTRIVAKASLFRIPIFGWAMRSAGFIPVDRSDHEKAIRSLGAAHGWLRARNAILMFPEGTRSRDGRLLPFKKGPFHLAAQTGVPVVPVAVSGSSRLFPAGRLVVRSGTMRVRFAPPVSPEGTGKREIDELLDRVRREIVSRLEPEEVAGMPGGAGT